MPTFFQRPENALKRANEFIDVEKPQRALDVLYDVIKSKKHRTWQKIHEPIMEKYLALCVDLKKSHIAKEGLYQYKIICQAVNIKSLEDVVRQYLQLAEQKTEGAKQESQQAVVNVDDLDVIQTPESLLLSAVSGEDTQDRTDRAILTPWVKFLWESYRQCLDLLRNNSSVERLYQDIAQQAFKFCLNYSRKTEFRKLCDNLRTHLGHIQKHQHQQRAINLNNPDSQAMHLETRLVQLDSAIQMELWQEAFKAIEDIHDLIALSKKTKPSLMANYYQKLGLVFWKSGNALFHACAWHRLLNLSREQRKNLSSDELVKLSSRVLCATLSIPIPAAKSQIGQLLQMDDNALEKQRRLSTLLGLSQPPTRTGLIKDLVKFNVVQHVYPELRTLYKVLETEYQPLNLSVRIQPPMDFIESKEDLAQYIPALQDITITRLLKQVSQLYEKISFERLSALMPFASQFHLERIVVHCAKDLDLQVRIDHQTRSLSFGTNLGVSQKEDIAEGPFLQCMPSEEIRNQLQAMATALHKAMNIIQPGIIKEQRDDLRAHIIQNYKQVARKEHARILTRRQIIEERKEELENINIAREREEQEQLEEQKRQAYAAEMSRLEREAQEREEQRRKEERNEIKKKQAKERLEQLRSTALGKKVFDDFDEESMVEMDPDEILAKQVEQLEKERKELTERLKAQEKKVDFFERAKRLEEIPMLEKQYEKTQVDLRVFWEHQEKERVETMKREREVALQNRDRLKRMDEDRTVFINQLKEARFSDYKSNLEDFEKKFVEERKKRLQERKVKRKEERRAKWIKEQEEEKQRLHDEELKRQREEEERLALEKKEKEEAEYNERLRKLEESAERQKRREREIEERLEAQKNKERDDFRSKGRMDDRDERDGGDWRKDDKRSDEPKTWRGAAAPPRDGGWREREKAREDTYNPRGRDEDWRREERGPRDDAESSPKGDDWRGERGPPRDDGGRDWRDKGPSRERDDKGPPPRSFDRERDDRGPPPRSFDRDRERDDRGPPPRSFGRDRDDRGPPPRSFERDRDWRQEKDNDDKPRESWRERGMPRDVRLETGWRDRGPARDQRGPPREDRGGWRDKRGDDRPPLRDRDDRPPRDRDDRDRDEGPWRRGPTRDDRGAPPKDDRGPPPRDRDPPPPRDRDLLPPRDRDPPSTEGGAWRRGPPGGDRGGPLSGDRGGDRGGDQGGNRGGDRGGGQGGDRGAWRDRGADRGGDDKRDDWRQREDTRTEREKDDHGASPKKPEPTKRQEDAPVEDDGWTTVQR